MQFFCSLFFFNVLQNIFIASIACGGCIGGACRCNRKDIGYWWGKIICKWRFKNVDRA